MTISTIARIITVADYKAFFGITDSDTDAKLSARLPGVCRALEQKCGRLFTQYEVDGLSIYYTGASETATVEVTATHLIIEDTVAGETTFSLSLAANDTLAELKTAVELIAGWNVAIDYSDGTADSADLTPVASQSCKETALSKTLGLRIDETVYFDGDGESDTLRPERFPVASVESLYDDTDRLFTSASDEIAATDFVISEGADYIVLDGRAVFAKGLKNIRLISRSGYAPADMPDDVKAVTCQALSFLMERAGKEHMRSELTNDLNYSTTFNLDWTPGMNQTVRDYKRRLTG